MPAQDTMPVMTSGMICSVYGNKFEQHSQTWRAAACRGAPHAGAGTAAGPFVA